LLSLAVLASVAPSVAEAQGPCVVPATNCRRLLVQSRYIDYYGNYDLGAYNPNIKRAVINVHGVYRTASTAFNNLVASAQLAAVKGFANNPLGETILLAPHFASDGPLYTYHRWNDGWAQGDQSVLPPTISSFAVIDAMIAELMGERGGNDHRRRFPNLETIVVAGHSAGGQFTHRYAATNGQDGSLPGIRMRYVVANPSSYLYLDGKRPHYDGSAGIGTPYSWSCIGFCQWRTNPGFSGAPICPGNYNDWRYGLDDKNSYAAAVGTAAIRSRLVNRSVIVLLGTADNDPNDPTLAKGCDAKLQGPHRYARGTRFLAYLNQQFPVYHGHSIVELAGVGHNSWSMFVGPSWGPAAGAEVLFEYF
jgi:hypothetical protein